MIDELRMDDVRDLIATEQTQVTILMPTLPAGPEEAQNPIRLRNLLREAERRLERSGVGPDAVARMLAPARALVDDRAFWSSAADGLALFIGEGWMREFRLPFALPEEIRVGERPFIRPLLPGLRTADARFHVLTISQEHVRLFAGDRAGLRPVAIALPQGVDEVLAEFSFEKSVQVHGGPRRGGGGGTPTGMFHGHGAGKEKEKTRLVELFRKVDRRVRDHLGARNGPLVLAGVDYLLPIYRQTNGYAELLDEGVAGNFDRPDLGELHAKAWALVEPRFGREQRRAARRYRELAGSELATDDPAEVVAAAHAGRVAELFLDSDREIRGRFDHERGLVEVGAGEPDEDLSNLATIHTISHRGGVHATPAGQVPGGGPIAAVLRY